MQSPYTVQQQMEYKRCGCDSSGGRPPSWILDRIADEKLTGNYNVKKSNICGTCNEAKSVNGSCACS